ncbi:MAG TPA: hypothetical protein VFD73_25785, partial [Gemmatimonadales bacterium]|nr:hypothetical protein [Gemmatimonadales bacterium]
LESRVREHPNEWLYHGFLSWAYAYERRKADAIREGQSAESITPLSKDAVDGLGPIYFLARSYMLTGELDSAVARLDTMLSVPSNISTTTLRFDPVWDELRGNPHFEEMVAEHR